MDYLPENSSTFFFRDKFKDYLFNVQLFGISIILYIFKLLHSRAHYVCSVISLTYTQNKIKLSKSEEAQCFVQSVLGSREQIEIIHPGTVYSSISLKYILQAINPKGCSINQEFKSQISVENVHGIFYSQIVTIYISIFEKPGVKEICLTLFNLAFLKLI